MKEGKKMGKPIMIQGTMSNAGKSLIAAALCRIFHQDGYSVCPFKSQNMALNSYITEEGLEMGRAQVMQAEAAGIRPSVKMNPILLKPNSDTGSQIIVNGEVWGNMGAWEYYRKKQAFLPDIMKSYRELEKEYDIIVIEGAGSPAEINLKENDFVNMGMARLADAPVLLVGDIDRGGVFAQLYGTVALLEEEEQKRIQGMIINKFRGDVSILEPGLRQLEELTKLPVLGTVPYMKLDIDDEDSLSERLHGCDGTKAVRIAVIRTPRMSNFTDFAALEQMDEVSVYYAGAVKELHEPDLILLPGTKSTIADLLWMRQNGLEAAVLKAVEKGTPVFGICGGYQMLGEEIRDPFGIEGGGNVKGLGVLPVVTVLERKKHRTNLRGKFQRIGGIFEGLSGMECSGYEIHHGKTVYQDGAVSLVELPDGTRGDAVSLVELPDGTRDGAQKGNVYGTYLHGIFDENGIAGEILRALLERKGIDGTDFVMDDRKVYKERQYDLLADGVRASLDMEKIYRILELN
jgi:adenosylcobyric acid synthase